MVLNYILVGCPCAVHVVFNLVAEPCEDCARTPARAQEYLKYIGVLVDKNLTWKYHIDAIAAKISKTIGLISKLHTSSNTIKTDHYTTS